MYLISAERYKNAGVDCLKIRETDKRWVSMKNVGAGFGIKNISDLISKEIYGIYEKKKELTKEETKCYKMTEREIYEKFDSLRNISKNKIKGKSKYAICLTERTFIDETEGDLERELEIYLHFFTD